jgi:hypothetical protein
MLMNGANIHLVFQAVGRTRVLGGVYPQYAEGPRNDIAGHILQARRKEVRPLMIRNYIEQVDL